MEIFQWILSVINTFSELNEAQMEKLKDRNVIFHSIKTAFRETIKHIDKTRKGEDGLDVSSEKLRDLWWEASGAIRPIYPDLARTFEDKSDYWTDPERFKEQIQTGERRFNYKFRLNEVERQIKALERKWFK